jgi:hypothetical protein
MADTSKRVADETTLANSKAVTLFPNPKRHSYSKAMEWDK